ncbi:putative glycolipid-binding domain-containing protein [Runella sp.]|uniref:putative glycolipid-binding domain-containing protein n=1 Tax=Runella sp. TaxID=1960881 RepID=UPI003D12C11C
MSLTLQKNILWTGIEYHSIENCVLTIKARQVLVNSTIVGLYKNIIYKVDYQIKTNQDWEAFFVKITAQLNADTKIRRFQSDGKGNWTVNGQLVEEYNGCLDIDISLTPFTNTLPINRLKLAQKEERTIQVLYVDVLGEQLKPVHQKYTRLSRTEYNYANIPKDFEATLTVDESGLVVNYPSLFKRTFIMENNSGQ